MSWSPFDLLNWVLSAHVAGLEPVGHSRMEAGDTACPPRTERTWRSWDGV